MVSLKVASVLLIVALLSCGAVGVYGAVMWEQQINWAWSQAIQSFDVEGNTVLDYGMLVSNSSVIKTESYNVTNTGNVDVTVKADVAVYGDVGVAWDKTEALIKVGETAQFNLTLTISGAGNCVVTFKIL